MSDMHPAIASFFDQLTAQMREHLAGVQPDGTTVSWSATNSKPRADLIWWSCGISVDPGAFVFSGAQEEDWKTLARAYDAASDQPFENDFGGLLGSLKQAAQSRFGAEVQCEPDGPSADPAGKLGDRPVSADIEISFRDGALSMTLALTSGLVEALGGLADSTDSEPELRPLFPVGDGSNPVDRLLFIEVPVSVSLGKVQMRMKDVLALNSGSIVELEQELGDRVEIRANNCVIARGEMVAVDGNYGVRILEMVSSQFAAGAASPNGDAERRGA